MAFAALAILPLLIYDTVRTTHRIAGPLLRFRETLKRLRHGEYVSHVQLREGDLLTEFQGEFNRFLDYYNSQVRESNSRQAMEEQMLHAVEEIRDELHHERRGEQPDITSATDPTR